MQPRLISVCSCGKEGPPEEIGPHATTWGHSISSVKREVVDTTPDYGTPPPATEDKYEPFIEGEFGCPHCPRTFIRRDQMQAHVAFMHAVEDGPIQFKTERLDMADNIQDVISAQITRTLTVEATRPHQEILKFFSFDHLKDEKLRSVSRSFAEQALVIVAEVPSNPERTVALRKLLEAKDAAVRAAF